MKKIIWNWKNIFFLICGTITIGIGTLISCYGIPTGENDPLNDIDYAAGIVYGDLNNNGIIDEREVVPGIKISVYRGEYVPTKPFDASTDIDLETKNTFLGTAYTLAYDSITPGQFCIHFDNKSFPDYDFIFKLEDVDGEENGSFEKKIVRTNHAAFYLEKSVPKF